MTRVDRIPVVMDHHTGHLEFGALLRPTDFDGWLDLPGRAEPDSPEFSYAYWAAAYAHVLNHAAGNVRFVSYERCCASPEEAMRIIGDVLDITDKDDLMRQATRFRAPKMYEVEAQACEQNLLTTAASIHGELLAQALF